MAISRVGYYNWVSGTSVSISTPTTGDLLLAFVYKDGANSAVPTPTGFTVINNSPGANSNSAGLFYKVSTGAETSVGITGTFTSMIVVVYRGASTTTPIGGVAITGSTATSVTYLPATMTKMDGTSWVVGCAGHRSLNTTIETPPSGMAYVTGSVDATDESVFHDTNGGVSTWGGGNVAVGGTASGWRTITCEILSDDQTKYVSMAVANTESFGAVGTPVAIGAHVSASTASNTTTTAAVTTTGGTLYAFVIADMGTTLGVTDNKGNTFTQISSGTRPASNAACALFRCVGFTPGSGHTFTGTSSTTYYVSIVVVEVPEMTNSAQQEAFTALTLDSASPFTTSITTTDATLVLVFNTSSGVTYTAPLTSVEEFTTDPTTYWSIHAAAVTGVTTGAHTYTIGSSSADVMAAAVALKPSSSGAIPIDRTRGYSLEVAESTTVTAALKKLQTVAAAIAETYGYTAAIDKTSSGGGGTTKLLTLSVDETNGYVGAINRTRLVVAALNEILTQAAASQRSRTTVTTISEAVVLAEVVSRARDLQSALTEQYGSTTSAARARDLQATIAELEAVAVQAMKIKLLGFLIAETESTSNVIVNRVRNHAFTVSQLEGVQSAFGRVRSAIVTVPETESVSIHFGRIRDEALYIAETESVDAAIGRVRGVLQDIANVTDYTFTLSNLISQDTNNLTITVSWEEWVYTNGALTLTPRSSSLVFTGKTASAVTVPAPGESIIVIPDPLSSEITMQSV